MGTHVAQCSVQAGVVTWEAGVPKKEEHEKYRDHTITQKIHKTGACLSRRTIRNIRTRGEGAQRAAPGTAGPYRYRASVLQFGLYTILVLPILHGI